MGNGERRRKNRRRLLVFSRTKKKKVDGRKWEQKNRGFFFLFPLDPLEGGGGDSCQMSIICFDKSFLLFPVGFFLPSWENVGRAKKRVKPQTLISLRKQQKYFIVSCWSRGIRYCTRSFSLSSAFFSFSFSILRAWQLR